MDEVRTSESIQLLGTLWSFLVAYGLWVLPIAVFVAILIVLYLRGRK